MLNTNIIINSCGVCLPSGVVKSDDLFEEIGTDKKYGIPTNWMSEFMGIFERRSAECNDLPSDIAVLAAEEALAGCPDYYQEEIDILIFCGIERDHTEPATAHVVNRKLGLAANYVFDISNACFGFIDGMEVASALIKSGIARRALIVTGEKQRALHDSLIRQMQKGVDIDIARNMLGFLSLGDAGGAVVMSAGEPGGESGFNLFNRKIDSSLVELCYYHPSDTGEIDAQMRMSRIVALGFNLHRDMIDDTYKKAGWNNIDWLLSHQTGKRSFQVISEMNLIEEPKCVRTYPKLGNVTSATFPVSFKKLLSSPKLKRGDKVGGFFGGSGLVAGQFAYTI